MNSFTVTAVGNLAKNSELAVKGDGCARTRLPALFGNYRLWKASSYCLLFLDPPDRRARRGETDNPVATMCAKEAA
jgi:hypothetical protein